MKKLFVCKCVPSARHRTAESWLKAFVCWWTRQFKLAQLRDLDTEIDLTS